MRILGIDVETTGLDCTKDRIIEIAAVLWDWESATPLLLYSALVDPRMEIPAEITAITGITQSHVDEFGEPEEKTINEVDLMLWKADYVMAHNAPFDKGFWDAAAERSNAENCNKPWLDSLMDIVYPKTITTRNLNYLAAEMGIINPWRHRAIFDVMTMLKMAAHYNIEAIIARSREPMVYLQACVSFDEKEKAKERGYRWYAPTKLWWKGFKLSDSEVEVAECGFRTNRLERAPE